MLVARGPFVPTTTRLSRRSLLRAGALLPIAVATACGGSKAASTTNTAARDEIAALQSAVEPEVARLIEAKFLDTDPHRLLLLRFFADAMKQSKGAPSGDLPMIVSPVRGRTTPDKALDLALQKQIVEQRLYRFLEVRPGREVIVVYTAPNPFLSSVDIENVRNVVDFALPRVDALFGAGFENAWLHDRIFSEVEINYTNGFNLLFSEQSQSRYSTVTHEIGHLYNGRFAGKLPTFLIEGVPDVVALTLTGEAAYTTFATGKPVRLRYTTLGNTAAVREESGNGLQLLTAIRDAISIETLMAGVNAASIGDSPTGLAVLHEIKRRAPKPDDLEALYRQRVSDYTQNSA